jgi:Xaa-Pro aminopeptidase
MQSDLDDLLHNRNLGAIIVPMHEAMHPAFRWLTRGAKVTRGYAVKLVDADPVLVTYPMERSEGAATGLSVRLAAEFDSERIFRTATSAAAAYGEFFDRILRELGARESIAFFGNGPLHLYLGIGAELERRGWRVQRGGEDLVQLARKRKEGWEVEAIRSVGARTEEVVDLVRDALRERRARKIGELKELVSFEVASRGMFEDHETILSHGRDAGIPHSRGNANDPIRDGVPIVLDIFPADRASGYFFDLTRTFCVGAPPPELRQLHAHVFEAFELARDKTRPGTAAAVYQHLVCDFFESRGYPTIRSHPATHEGYVHGLGHGVGLEIHEKPSFSILPSNVDQIEVGDIVTIEPGLYFPDRNLGVRIEDTFVVTADGVETLCRGSYALEP